MEKSVSTELVSTEPRRRVLPKLNYWAMALRAFMIFLLIVALIVGPALLSGKLQLPARIPDLPAPHAPDLGLLDSASMAIKIHLFTVVGAAVIGIVLMARIKGTPFHRQLGWIYAAAMFSTAIVTLTIPRLPVGPHLGPFGPLHLFSAFTLYGVPAALLAARQGDWATHGKIMASLFIGGIGIAGLGAFMPGRLMNQMFFG
jgi:uncharacterized membrane protein